MADQKGRERREVSLEEDDTFEEFENEDWKEELARAEAEAQLWQPDWDDEDTNPDFAQRLKAEIAKMG